MPAIRSFTGSASQISFEGNWVGPAQDQTVHTLRRSDLAGLGLNQIPAIETYINGTWLPHECRDVNGARQCFAMIRVLSVSQATLVCETRVSDTPIDKWW